MSVISVKGTPCGVIRPLNGVGQPPFEGIDFSMCHYLKEANIPYSRLHDVGGLYGGNMFVDIPNLFRDFDADENDPASYDFGFTDILMKGLTDNGVEPYFRLGVTIENYSYVKAYRIYPPKDFAKWARICEHVIRHYNEGWADGFHYGIRHWEIWNEPENDVYLPANKLSNEMWLGTHEQFFELYTVTAKHLKKCFPDLKIGGYGACGFFAAVSKPEEDVNYPFFLTFIDFFNEFMTYIKKENAPLDFFSWHSYAGVSKTMKCAAYVREALDRYGYGNTESHLNEWNVQAVMRGKPLHTAHTAAMILGLQSRTTVDASMFYDARLGISIYGGLFHPLTREPFPAYYAMAAFGEMRRMGQYLPTESAEPVYAAAATDGREGMLLLSNDTSGDTPIEIVLPEGRKAVSCARLNGEGLWEAGTLPTVLHGWDVWRIRF